MNQHTTDAELIAELLEALKNIVENEGHLFPSDWHKARAAIAKATGEA